MELLALIKLSIIFVTAWLLLEHAKIIGASSPLIVAFTTSVATILCSKVVFPVPGGPFTAVILFSSEVK